MRFESCSSKMSTGSMPFRRILAMSLALAGLAGSAVSATAQSGPPIPIEDLRLESPDGLARYVPLLPAVKADVWKIDPNLGYGVRNVGHGIYVMSDNGWQSAFVVTGDGVIVLDAPSSYGKRIVEAVTKVTNQPIKVLIYSHEHKDHIGAAGALMKSIPNLRIVGLDTVADFLSEKQDPNRPVPTETFTNSRTIKMGGITVELTRHQYHSAEGDLFIYIPEAKFMMAIDCVTAGYAPFQGFDITTNFDEYLQVFDQILAYDFDTFVGGHLTNGISTRKDVVLTKEFTFDVYNAVKRIHNNMSMSTTTAAATKAVGSDNEFLLFKVFLDKVTYDAVTELRPRWINRLAGVDVFLESHVRTALIYVRWDDND
jgi:glyoxylase-like metal-dependent hydrolase (beta-lactamase superfamily II)